MQTITQRNDSEVRNALASQLVSLMQSVLRRSRPLLAEELSPVELTMAQFRTMTLVVGGVSRPGEIAVALGVKPPAVSGIIDRLVVKGLIERRQEDDDRRTVSCTLTRAGMDELDRIFRVSERRVRAMAESLSSEELADVVRCMKILARAAEARPASGRQSDQIVNQDGITI